MWCSRGDYYGTLCALAAELVVIGPRVPYVQRTPVAVVYVETNCSDRTDWQLEMLKAAELFFPTSHVFLHRTCAVLHKHLVVCVSSTRLLDLKKILKLESILEKATDPRLWDIQNGCYEIGNPLGRTDGPNLQAYRGVSPNKIGKMLMTSMMMLREYECLLARFDSLKTP